MNRSLQHTTAVLLLGIYGLVISVSGAFHNHPLPACPCHAAGHGHHAPEASCPAHGRRNPAGHPNGEGCHDAQAIVAHPSGTRPHRGECAVCAFLAQKPVQTASVAEVNQAYLVRILANAKAIARAEKPFSAIWSRGPPSDV